MWIPRVVECRLPFLLVLALSAGCSGRGAVKEPEAAKLSNLPPGTHKETVNVPDVGDLTYAIEIPSGYDGKTPVPLVLALHSAYEGETPGTHIGTKMIEVFRPELAALKAIVIAPHALGGSWTNARNEQAVVWLTKTAMETYAIDENKVVITGFSVGGEGAWFIGSRHQDLFKAAVPVAAPEAGEDATWKIPVYVIHSNTDQVVPYSDAKKHAEAIKAKGAKLEFKTASALDHYDTSAYGTYIRAAVKWLQAEWK